MTGFLVAQVVALAAGLLFLTALRWWKLPVGLLVPSAWLAGTGLLAAERLLLAQVGLPWTPLTLAPPWLALAALAAWRLRGATWRWPEISALRRQWSNRDSRAPLALAIEAISGLLIVLWTISLLRRTLSQPLAGWDALVIWIFKGRALYETGTVPLSFFNDPEYAVYAHLDYPLLVPLSVARMYSWMGDQEVLVKGWWALLAGAAAAGLYFGLAGLAGRVARLSGLVLLISMPAMMVYGADNLAGYAELPLAVFILYGALFLYRWLRNGAPGEFGLSALFFGMAGFTKNEGLVTCLAGLALLVVLALARRGSAKAPLWQSLLLAGLIFVPWQVEKAVYGITGDLQPSLWGIIQNWNERIGTILGNIAWYAADVNLLNVVWLSLPLLSIAVLIFMPRKWLFTLPLLLVILAHFAGTIAAYLTTPHDLTWHLGTSADRLVFQPVLTAVLLGTIYLSMLLDREPAADSSHGLAPASTIRLDQSPSRSG